MVGDETSDIAMDDTARLVHERTRKEGRVDKKSSRDSEELSSGSNGPKRLRTGCLRVSSVNALQDPPTRVKRASSKVVQNIKHLFDTGAVKDWNREEAISTRDLWMTHTRNSRGGVR